MWIIPVLERTPFLKPRKMVRTEATVGECASVGVHPADRLYRRRVRELDWQSMVGGHTVIN